jgi:hypothetical protein
MKFTEQEFKKFIISEAKKLIENEDNFSFELKEEETIQENDNIEECGCDVEQSPEGVGVMVISSDNFEEVNPEEFQEEAEEAKQLSEELTRMKQLLNFNNPLLKL